MRPETLTPAGPARHRRGMMLLAAVVLVLAGCQTPPDTSVPTDSSRSPTGTASPTETQVPPTATPTATPLPLAARVNGQPILLQDYEAHLARLLAAESAFVEPLSQETAALWALDDLINQTLLSQAAAEAGFLLDPAEVDARLQSLADSLGGPTSLEAWQSAQGYTPDSFRRDLETALAAAWMRDRIVAKVPDTAEQIHAHQILLFDRPTAEDVLRRLEAGASFDNLARTYDPQGLGDLGWFPRGYLTEPAVETAAFELDSGQLSRIIETQLGYHILLVIERAAERPLEPDAHLSLQTLALQEWLEDRRSQSDIQIFLPDQAS